jgi:hypothetical protein
MPASVCDLWDLAKGRLGLTPSKGASLAEAAAVCLQDCGHVSPVTLRVEGDRAVERKLLWPGISPQQCDTYADLAEATEEGACAIAMVVIETTMGLVVMERSRKKSAFDYWLGDEPSSNFQRKVRLEVTGILKGDEAAIEKRLSEKLERFEKYPNAARALVAVVEFGTPLAKVVTK